MRKGQAEEGWTLVTHTISVGEVGALTSRERSASFTMSRIRVRQCAAGS
jgi:hypothetical protein